MKKKRSEKKKKNPIDTRSKLKTLHSNTMHCVKSQLLIFLPFSAKLKIKESPWCKFEMINKQLIIDKCEHWSCGND